MTVVALQAWLRGEREIYGAREGDVITPSAAEYMRPGATLVDLVLTDDPARAERAAERQRRAMAGRS